MKKLSVSCPWCGTKANRFIGPVDGEPLAFNIQCEEGHIWQLSVIPNPGFVTVQSDYQPSLEEIKTRAEIKTARIKAYERRTAFRSSTGA